MNLAWAVALVLVFVAASGQARLLLRNGTVAPAIVDGYIPPAGSRPWMVSLRQSNDNIHFCGGTLVDARVVLTAAHCVSNVDNGGWMLTNRLKPKVVVGGYPQSVQAPADFVRKVVAVRRHIKFNMGFKQDRMDNDVALLLLDKPIPKARDGYVKTIILPNPQSSVEVVFPQWEEFLAAGWGYTDVSGETPANELQEINMALLAPSSCQLQAVYGSGSWTNKITKKTYTVPYNWSKNNLFCMRDTVGSYTPGMPFLGGICGGDSGGPVFKDLGGGRAVQWGIASFAKQLGGNLKCGRSFSAYTDVAALRNWIDDGVTLLTRTTFLATFDSGLSAYQGFHRRWVATPPAYLQANIWFSMLKTGGTKGAELLARTAATIYGPGIGALWLGAGSKEFVLIELYPSGTLYVSVQGKHVPVGPVITFPNGKAQALLAQWGQTRKIVIQQATMTLTVTQPWLPIGWYQPYLSLAVEIKKPFPTLLGGILTSTMPDSKQYVAPP